jgi:hypothetical protein
LYLTAGALAAIVLLAAMLRLLLGRTPTLWTFVLPVVLALVAVGIVVGIAEWRRRFIDDCRSEALDLIARWTPIAESNNKEKGESRDDEKEIKRAERALRSTGAMQTQSP